MFGFISAAEQAIRERVKVEALEEANNRVAANVDYVAMMCDVDLDTEEITDELNPGDHFYLDDGKEYVFEGTSDSGDILAAEYSNEEGESNE